jgi:hypothetical protein
VAAVVADVVGAVVAAVVGAVVAAVVAALVAAAVVLGGVLVVDPPLLHAASTMANAADVAADSRTFLM